jgi:hypothetical protein
VCAAKGPLANYTVDGVGGFRRLLSAAIDWKGHYRIEGRAFVYTDRESGRVTTILGYPTAKIAQLG